MNYKYYKGDFTGLSSKKDSVLSIGKHNFYDFNWSYIQIKNINEIEAYEVEKEKIGDYYYSDIIKPKKCFHWPFYLQSVHSRKFEIKYKKDYFWIEYVSVFLPKIKKRTEVFISVNEENYFNENLNDVLLKDIKLKEDSNLYVKKEFVELNGTIYFKIEIPEVKKPISTEFENNSGMNRSEKVVLSDDIDNTKIIEGEYIATGSGNIIKDPIKEPVRTFPIVSRNWLSKIFGIFFWLFLLSFFWLFLNQYFYLALFGAIGWLISRFLTNRFLKTGFNLIFGAVFLMFLATLFSNKGSLIDPTVPKKEGTIKISPPKQVKTDDSNFDDPDYEIEKEINWYDFITNKYGLKYITTVKSFFETQKNHNSVDKLYSKTSTNPISYFNKLYSNLEAFDSKKIDSIVKVLGKKASEKKLNQIQTAEMVVTFIQEIPYVLVHQNSCEQVMHSDKEDSFIVTYHQDKKPCLPNIPGGVQSPYEFLHNLKGDCDTRSLLGYAILKKMNISASVWVSQAYGHSILGVGLPIGNGVSKNINGLNHYGVELTSKGFRLGVISPQQRDMSNWDIALYFNNFK
jgi:hypothetical protein